MDRTINFSESYRGGWYILGILGRMDTNTAPIGEEHIKSAMANHIKIALDLSGLNYISSAGLRVLLRVAKTAAKEKKELVICGADGMVKEILDDFDIEGFYTVYDSIEQLDNE